MAALDFIDKSLECEDFQKRLESIILLTCKKIQSQNPEDAFRIENVKTVIQVPFHDILYFETSDIVHKVILYTKEEQIEFYGSLSQIEKSDPRLFKCHKSFLVNPENIIKLDKSTGDGLFWKWWRLLCFKVETKEIAWENQTMTAINFVLNNLDF